MTAPENGVPLEEVLVYVERALQGDRRLRSQLFAQFQQLANLPSAPPEERALGRALARILLGNLDVDLDGLPPEPAAELRRFLARLKQGSQNS